MKSSKENIIYQGNSLITIENIPDYTHPVTIKKSSRHDMSREIKQSLEKEYEMTKSLDKVEGVRKALDLKSIDDQPVLVLEYIAGNTIKEYIEKRKYSLRSRLEIAINLAQIIKNIHQQNVVHLDLSSENIIIGQDEKKVYIIDFGSASYIDRSGQQKVKPGQLFDSLAYIAPEQTGRINRVVDDRSDLYSLGVVLYELMTGQLPFDSKDPLKLVHNHIALVPVSPSEVSSGIPDVLSAIILKLMSKNAEDRYQSSAGVQVDLEKCLLKMSPEEAIEEFPLGKADYSSRLRFPQKLYGRDNELKELENSFYRACQENSSIMFVNGYSGIGKTTLVEELHQQVSEKSGYFIRGKFDQHLRTSPYTAVAQAFGEYVSLILAEPEKIFNEWRNIIQSAVGDLGGILTEVIPTLRELLGSQPDVTELGGQEAENRFNFVFINFLSRIATEEHPLVLFIDDLQWIDGASLKLLSVIRSEFKQPGLFLVGAYRDNEVDNSHPLMEFVKYSGPKSMKLHLLQLHEIKKNDLKTLLSDTLRTKKSLKDLEEVVLKKTHGNPFFLRRLLSSLNEEGRIGFDPEVNSWKWNIDDLKSEKVADNVADLLGKNIALLPEKLKNLLAHAAYIGNKFDLKTLSLISGMEEQEISLLFTTNVSSQYVEEMNITFEFVHDQVQQAAYSLIDEKSRIKKHLDIGRLMYAHTKDSELEERIFDIVTHFNMSAHLLTDLGEKIQIVQLNLNASRKAKIAAAFTASIAYLRQGLVILGENGWQNHYKLTLDIHNELIDTCFLNIEYEEVDLLFRTLLDKTKQDIDACMAYKTMIVTRQARNELASSISLADEYLNKLGINFIDTLDPNLSVNELINLPPIHDKKREAALEIMMAITAPVYISATERLPSLAFTMVDTVNRFGHNHVSGPAYSWYSLILCFGMQYKEANHFSKLSLELLKKYPHPGISSQIMDVHYAFIRHWESPVHNLIDPLKKYYLVGMQEGNYEWGLWCLLNHTLLIWGTGKPLDFYLAEVVESIEVSRSKSQEVNMLMFMMFAESASNLTGISGQTTQLEGSWFSEKDMWSRLEGNTMLLVLYWLQKMTLSYLFDKQLESCRYLKDLIEYRASLNPHYLYTKISFFGGLSCVRGMAIAENDAERQDLLEKLMLFESDLKMWAEVAPMNYQHQYDLVMAEKCRVSEKHWEATQLYEKAIKGARENQFIHDQALATELSGRFWMEQSNDTIAETYIRKAHQLYHQWGALTKVKHLEKSYPNWFETESILLSKSDIPDDTDKILTAISTSNLDMESIISASQMLSAETDLEQLLSKMIALVMANSGAEKSVLLIKQENDWFMQAMGDSTSEKYDVLLNQPFNPAGSKTNVIPESIFNYCERTKNVLILDNAQSDDRFSGDKTIQKQNIQSIACIPVLNHGEIKSMMYLENRQLTDVFNQERIEVLKHLSTQFGISTENALLYENLNQKILELKESEERLSMVFEHALEVIIVAQDEKIKYCNPHITELTGYSLDEIYSMNFTEFLHPDEVKMVMHEYRERLSGKKTKNRFSARIITKDDQEKFILISSNLVNWDGEPATLAMLSDITQLKKAEFDLIKSDERYALAVSGSAAGIWDWDIVINKLYTSPRFKELIGYESDEIDISLDVFFNLLHPEDLDKVQLVLERHLKEHLDYDIDYRLSTKSGKYRWFHARGQALWDKTGKAKRMSGSITDISKRKKAEEETKRSEERFRQMMEQSPLAIEILSVDGKINFINTAWKKMWKVSDEEAAETIESYNMLTDPQNERLGIMDEIREAFKGKHIILPPVKYDTGQTVEDFDLKFLKKFKSPWIQCHLNTVKDANGEIDYIVNTYVDITDLKEVEEILAKSEARYRHLVEHSPLSIAIFTPEGKLSQVNDAWKKLWGLSEEETLQVMETYNIFTDKQTEEYGFAPLVERAFKGEDIIMPPMEYVGAHATEEMKLEDIKAKSSWIQSHFYSVQHANGNLDYVVNINMDLTELRQAEKETQQQRDVIARIDRTSSMGQLTGSIAHELNQPLTGILSNAQAAELILKSKNWDLEEIKEILTEIIGDTKRAGDVIRNLRELFTKQKVELLPVDMNTVVQEAVKLLQSEFIVQKANLTTSYDSATPMVKGNKIQIQQVIFNLIMNGIQAMIDMEPENRKLWVTTSFDADEVTVFVTDNGKGINPKIIDSIFEPLATWKPGGTGMGLAISNSIIQAHGGRMIAENQPGGGACVCFVLPEIKNN